MGAVKPVKHEVPIEQSARIGMLCKVWFHSCVVQSSLPAVPFHPGNTTLVWGEGGVGVLALPFNRLNIPHLKLRRTLVRVDVVK